MRLGITGIQGAGKTTVFRLFTLGKLATPPASNVGSVDIPDPRLDWLSVVFKPKKTTYAKLEFLDPPGFAISSFSMLQTTDALIYVIPFFGKFKNPTKPMEELSSELILRDSGICDGVLKKSKELKQKELLERCRGALLESTPLRELKFSETEEKYLKGFGFLTQKPAVVIVNLEKDERYNKFTELPVVDINAKLELEILEMSERERGEYKEEFGIEEWGLERFVRIGFPRLEVISFFTVVGDEVRSWQIPSRTTVIKAAGKVHSDMERGFIRAEVIRFEDFKEVGSLKVAKEKGLVRTVKHDYVVQDGDIIEFKFKV